MARNSEYSSLYFIRYSVWRDKRIKLCWKYTWLCALWCSLTGNHSWPSFSFILTWVCFMVCMFCKIQVLPQEVCSIQKTLSFMYSIPHIILLWTHTVQNHQYLQISSLPACLSEFYFILCSTLAPAENAKKDWLCSWSQRHKMRELWKNKQSLNHFVSSVALAWVWYG